MRIAGPSTHGLKRPVHAQLAHVAERHRLAGWLLLFGHGVVLSMKEKAQRWAGLR